MNEVLEKYLETVPVIKNALGLDMMMSITDGYNFLGYWKGDKIVADIHVGDELNHDDPMWQVFQSGKKMEAVMPASVYGFEFKAIMIPIKDGSETVGTMGIAISLENENFTTATAEKLLNNINNASGSMETIHESSDEISSESAVLQSSIEKLLKNITEIQTFVKDINAISNKTNILALNASIEAARSGEAGKGFAVVAQNMRELAGNTKDSSNKIFELLKSIDEDVTKMQKALTSVSEAQDKQKSETDALLSGIKEIEELTGELAKRMKK
ncbi:MAG: methyl-accepting chemotaxis protein [Lachnospiraceae bacterium]|nr:methyl-accepting chemotaxis protein [Lachnospiraceae bacterium]